MENQETIELLVLGTMHWKLEWFGVGERDIGTTNKETGKIRWETEKENEQRIRFYFSLLGEGKKLNRLLSLKLNEPFLNLKIGQLYINFCMN